MSDGKRTLSDYLDAAGYKDVCASTTPDREAWTEYEEIMELHESALTATRLEDTKAICKYCDDGIELKDRNGHLVHYLGLSTGGVIMERYRPCNAGPIHDLIAQEKKK